MYVHGVKHILTLNVADFSRFDGLTSLHIQAAFKRELRVFCNGTALDYSRISDVTAEADAGASGGEDIDGHTETGFRGQASSP